MSIQSDWLTLLATRGATEILTLSWQALLLILLVWLGLKLFRVKRAGLRHQVWLLTLIAIVALPIAGMLAPRFPQLHTGSTAVSSVIEAPRAALRLTPLLDERKTLALEPNLPAQPSLLSRLADAPRAPFFLAIWLIGALMVLARLVREQVMLRQIRKRARVVTPTDLNVSIEAPASRRVEFRLSAEIGSPQISGVFRPVVLLPADLTDWTTVAERRAMIQHELAHVARFDPLVNLFQTTVRVVFFFHPAIRYVSREMSLERELACDDQVVAMGAQPETYAESLLKVAERSLLTNARYQIAFFSAKHTLERRVEMILNREGTRVLARHWPWTILAALLIAGVAWVLVPSTMPSGVAQTRTASAENQRLVKELGDNKAYDKLIELATQASGALRRLAAVRLTELEGDGSTAAMVELFNRTSEAEVKIMVIDALARISEIEPLTKIALSDQNAEYRQRALQRIKYLKTNSESADVRNWNAPGLAEQLKGVKSEGPPPPPPARSGSRRSPPPPPARP
ncbi:MAG: M56 family metallopeptidase [Pyrinomonadaceae bacterium]